MNKRNFNRLRAAIDRRNAKWLEDCHPDIDNALREELADGASPEEIASFTREISGEQDWFAKKVAGAARHISSVKAR